MKLLLGKIHIKALLYAMIVVFMAAGLAACGTSHEDAARKAGEDFIKQLDTFGDVDKIIDNSALINTEDSFPKKFEQHMTKEGFNNFYGQRIGYIAVLAGFYNKSNVEAQDVNLELKSKDEKADVYYYFYTADVKLTPLSGGSVSNVKVTGEITMKKDNGEFKVHYFNILSKDWLALAKRA